MSVKIQHNNINNLNLPEAEGAEEVGKLKKKKDSFGHYMYLFHLFNYILVLFFSFSKAHFLFPFTGQKMFQLLRNWF